jgi:phage gp36-like protein
MAGIVSYSSTTELGRLGVAAAYLAALNADEQAEGLACGYDTCNGYFRAANYPVPIPAADVGHDVKRAECAVGAWSIVSVRGWDPNSESDKALRQAYEDALAWLTQVAKGIVKPFPSSTTDAVPESEELGSYAMDSDDLRGW